MPGLPRLVLPVQASALWSPGVLSTVTNAGLIQVRSIRALGWSWKETWEILNVQDVDHVALTAFIKKAWQRGEIFDAVHPLRPGSGITPNGLGTAGVLVKGASQVGDELITDGWPTSTADCVVVGDVIKVAGEDAVYQVTATAASDSNGDMIVPLNPPLRSTPADNAAVTTTDVKFLVTIMSRSRHESSIGPTHYGGYSLVLGEALL